ncbi:MAG: hypothetical protein ACTH2Q_06415 [Propionibacteriaceae bacterium]
MTVTVIVIALVLVAALVGGIVLISRKVLRSGWVSDTKELGWRYEGAPNLGRVAALAHPPFDVGLERDVDEALIGHTTSGTPFQSFQYTYRGAGPGFRSRVAMVSLPFGLPEFYVGTRNQHRRLGVDLPEVTVNAEHAAQIQVRTADPDFAHAALPPRVWPLLADWSANAPLDLSFDGASLVAVNVPEDPDELARVLDRLDAVREAINPEALEAWAVPVKQPRLGFQDRDWQWAREDARLLPQFSGVPGYSTSGYGHHATNVVIGTAHGLRLIAFTHDYVVQRNNNRHARAQHLVSLQLPVAVPNLHIARKTVLDSFGLGSRIQTGHPDFDQLHTVRGDAPRFAHDVLAPQLDFLLRSRAPDITLSRNLAIAWPTEATEPGIVACTDLLREFLARIPDRVWTGLGTAPLFPAPNPPAHR